VKVFLGQRGNVQIGAWKVQRHIAAKFFATRAGSDDPELGAVGGDTLHLRADAALVEANKPFGL